MVQNLGLLILGIEFLMRKKLNVFLEIQNFLMEIFLAHMQLVDIILIKLMLVVLDLVLVLVVEKIKVLLQIKKKKQSGKMKLIGFIILLKILKS